MSCRTSSHFLSSNKAPKTTNGQGKRSLFCMMKRVWKSRWISTHNFFFTWISSWINSGSIPTSKSGLHYFLKEPVHANRVFFFFRGLWRSEHSWHFRTRTFGGSEIWQAGFLGSTDPKNANSPKGDCYCNGVLGMKPRYEMMQEMTTQNK